MGVRSTAHDAAFSLTLLKEKGHPVVRQLLRDCAAVEAPDDATVVVRFAPNRARDVPLFVASVPIFSRTYYSGHPFDETTLEAPLGCGPYKVGQFEVGRFIEYERVKDWWGADLPVARGQHNFDTVRYEYYRDRDLAFQGFTAKNYLFREEFTSRVWATGYIFRRSTTAASAMSSRSEDRRESRAGSSTHDGRYSRTRACERPSSTRSISNGRTRPSCSGPISGCIPCSRIPT